MSRVGQVFDNPVTGERVVVLTDPFEHPDRVMVGHLTISPGGRVAVTHFHPNIRERFHVLDGQVGFRIGDEETVLGPGESAEVLPGTIHDWWQVGDTDASVLVEVSPGDRFGEMITTMFGLCRDGKSNDKGMPSPLQVAVIVDAYKDVMLLASPPPGLQKAIAAVLAPIGRMRGYRPRYEKYEVAAETVDPDPAALALLGEDGRLIYEA